MAIKALVVLVTGLPASGKTTLARRLSRALGIPLLAKDTIKESLFESLGVYDRSWSTRLGAASSEILWSLLADCPTGAVLDLWLDPRRDVGLAQRGLARAGMSTAYEVLCDCPGEVAAQRYAERTRHSGHLQADESTLQRILESGPLMGPLGVGPALGVDTTRQVDVAGILAWLRDAAIDPC